MLPRAPLPWFIARASSVAKSRLMNVMTWALIRADIALSRWEPESSGGRRIGFEPRESLNRTRLPTESNHRVTVVPDESLARNRAVTRVAPDPRLRVRVH